MQRRTTRLDGRNRRVSQRWWNLHRLHHARLPRQVHAVHGPATRFAPVFKRGDDLRPGDPRAAPLYPGFSQPRAVLAIPSAEWCGNTLMTGAFNPLEAEAILIELAGVFFQNAE